MKDFRSIFFSERAVSVDTVKEFPVFAILHKDVDLAVCFDHFIDLGDIFMEDMPLDIYLLLQSS